MIRLPFFRVRVELRTLRRDPHPFPHPMGGMDDGGCFCQCPLCVREDERGWRRCVCPRCNQDCAAVGRLGTLGPDEVMLGEGAPGRRWWWSR